MAGPLAGRVHKGRASREGARPRKVRPSKARPPKVNRPRDSHPGIGVPAVRATGVRLRVPGPSGRDSSRARDRAVARGRARRADSGRAGPPAVDPVEGGGHAHEGEIGLGRAVGRFVVPAGDALAAQAGNEGTGQDGIADTVLI